MTSPTSSAEYEIAGSGGRVVVAAVRPATPTRIVVLAHGFGEHAGRYGHVIERLVADGAIVHAPDHRGHGRSDGARAIVEDLDALVADLHQVVQTARREDPGLPVVLLGHSMGGLMAVRYAQLNPGLDGLALSGPFLGNPAFAPLLEMDPIPDIPIDPAVLSRDPAVGEAYAADPLVYHGPLPKASLHALFAAVDRVAAGPSPQGLPALWLHGEGDQLALYDAAKVLVEKVLGADLTARAYPGAQHEVFNETNKAEVLEDLAAFLARFG